MSISAVTRMTSTRVPTEYGNFQWSFYANTLDDTAHLALFVGDIDSTHNAGYLLTKAQRMDHFLPLKPASNQ